MIYILKNRKVREKTEYILFDSCEKTRANVVTTPEKAKNYCKKYGIEWISPLYAIQMLDYKKQTFGEFMPLPF
jgi:DNA-dependent RNA polymerase auxiliary subunit epsilon